MNYENGHTLPSAYAVFRLAQYYGCTMEDLLTQKYEKERKVKKLNNTQKALKRMIRDTESKNH